MKIKFKIMEMFSFLDKIKTFVDANLTTDVPQ